MNDCEIEQLRSNLQLLKAVGKNRERIDLMRSELRLLKAATRAEPELLQGCKLEARIAALETEAQRLRAELRVIKRCVQD